MGQINLKSSEMGNSPRRGGGGGGGALTFGIILLILSFGFYGAMFFLRTKTQKDIVAMENEVSAVKEKLNSKEIVELYDFQSRLVDLEEIMKDKINQRDNLLKISNYTLPDASFDSLKAEVSGSKTEFEGTIRVKDFYTLSKQVEAYSLLGEEIEDFTISGGEEKEEGVESTLTFTLKEAKKKSSSAESSDATSGGSGLGL